MGIIELIHDGNGNDTKMPLRRSVNEPKGWRKQTGKMKKNLNFPYESLKTKTPLLIIMYKLNIRQVFKGVQNDVLALLHVLTSMNNQMTV